MDEYTYLRKHTGTHAPTNARTHTYTAIMMSSGGV